ncbi:MAG: hypothetical protein JW827_01280 [Spirochaetes bacterium]|nr:hypothetical protein [Spirochaetota bacterium]
MGKVKEYYHGISGFHFDPLYIEIFVRLKLFFLLYFHDLNIELTRFDNFYLGLEKSIKLKENIFDPFYTDCLSLLDNRIDQHLKVDHNEIDLFWRTFSSFLIYMINRTKDCIQTINSIEKNLAEDVLKKMKMKLSHILKSLYPVDIYYDKANGSLEIPLRGVMPHEKNELRVNIRNIQNKEMVIDRLSYIIQHLDNIIKDVFLIKDFYDLPQIDFDYFHTVFAPLWKEKKKYLQQKKIDNQINVLTFMIQWSTQKLFIILETIRNETSR